MTLLRRSARKRPYRPANQLTLSNEVKVDGSVTLPLIYV